MIVMVLIWNVVVVSVVKSIGNANVVVVVVVVVSVVEILKKIAIVYMDTTVIPTNMDQFQKVLKRPLNR